MEVVSQELLVGAEIHGFYTMADLDVGSMMEEAKKRWLRPNEIHAILYNHKYFSINVKPVNLPQSGTVVLFDRKMLRNFRKDGHSWKKKKDGKTVKEAHEHLKVGNEERIHVYYAHGEDSPTFVRRCYWLLDKTMEHVVLVHYRETQELQGSPATPVNSNSSSDHSASWNLSEETDSGVDKACYTDSPETIKNHEMTLHELNTLPWEELVVPGNSNNLIIPEGGNTTSFHQLNQYGLNGHISNMLVRNGTSSQEFPTLTKRTAQNPSLTFFPGPITESKPTDLDVPDNIYLRKVEGQGDSASQIKASEVIPSGREDHLGIPGKDGMRTQDSFGRWMNYIMTDSPGSIDDPILSPQPFFSTGQESVQTPVVDQCQSLSPEQIFNITDISPTWALSSEETKVLVVGFFYEEYLRLASSTLFCVCGDVCVPAEVVQSGVFRCMVSPHRPGLFNLYLSFDGKKPISQVVAFEYRSNPSHHLAVSSDSNTSDWEEFQIQTRLAHLLFSTSKSLNILSSKVPPKNIKEAKIFASRISHIIDSWDSLIKSVMHRKISFPQARNSLLELTLHNRLHEWLLERVVDGSKIPDRDDQGQGVIHLCAILGYTWAIYPYSWSGLSLDYRDKSGWTALHWAAHYGREKMVASLLSAGAKPNLVTDPTSENPGGCTAADLASKNGFEGLGAYLAEKALVAHFNDMTIAGNVSGSLQSGNVPSIEIENPLGGTHVSEEEQCLKDTLTAYRTAADAAARIQAAFREQSFKLQSKAVQDSNPEDEARSIIAAMKIQHAFRNYETRKQMAAAARIQYRFRTWKIRKDFLNMRRQVVKIQAAFRGYKSRRQYHKIVWSVGVVEKAVLRWRLKRKGFRGLQVPTENAVTDPKQGNDGVEAFFHASRKQAEERVERSVVRVQAMFRSKRAQEDYRRMKLAHNEATLEYEGLLNPIVYMER